MTDWTSSQTLALQGAIAQKVSLILVGVCIHEFLASIAFDLRLVTKLDSRPLLVRAVKWVYICCRYCNLATCLGLVFLFGSHGVSHCSVVVRVTTSSCTAAVLCGSVLLFIRVGVIWKWDVRIKAVFALLFFGIAAVLLYTLVSVHSTFDATPGLTGSACDLSDIKSDLPYLCAFLALDASLLFFYFWGLWRRRYESSSALWDTLRRQSFVYLAVAVVLEIPALVFVALDYNEFVILIFMVPYICMLPIATARLYRSLTSFITMSDQCTTSESALQDSNHRDQ
ncbi:unnamed protein product [Peniophora sp. CBMAI 1063]|nr:unnamed protein product [Peniophora sp. CBMAI 1063]